MYHYRAAVLKVVDGDTVHLDCDLGFDIRREDSFRLAHIDAPEMSTPEGVAAKQWLADQLAAMGGVIEITTLKDRREKFGRFLCEIWHSDPPVMLNLEMIEAGHAVAYEGGTRGGAPVASPQPGP